MPEIESTKWYSPITRKVRIMTAKTRSTDELVAEMSRLSKAAGTNLVKFANLVPALYAAKPWHNPNMPITDYFRDTFGIGPADSGYIALPSVALDALVKQLGADVSYDDTMAMSGVGRATVARSRKRVGVTDPSKSAAIVASGAAGNPQTAAKAAAATAPRTGEAQAAAVAAAAAQRKQNASGVVPPTGKSGNAPADKPVTFTPTNVTPPLDRTGKPVTNTVPTQPSAESGNSGEFDLAGALAALDDSELTDVLAAVGFARIAAILESVSVAA